MNYNYKIIGWNNADAVSKFENARAEIYSAPKKGFFWIFQLNETDARIEEVLSIFGFDVCIDVFNSNYLAKEPSEILKKNEFLYFRELKTVFSIVENEQIAKITKYEKEYSFVLDTERLLQIYPDKTYYKEALSVDNWGLCMTGVLNSKLDGKDVKIAILDTGIDLTNSIFPKKRIEACQYFEEDDVQDYNGHGTHCAGIACGGEYNSMRYGVATASQILIGKVLNAGGRGRDVSLLKGILWAIKNKADIISISVERDSIDSKIDQVIDRALYFAKKKGAVVVAAAGSQSNRKEWNPPDPISSPANSRYALAVGAVDRNKRICNFSNQADLGEKQIMSLVAPGEAIYSTWSKIGDPQTEFKSGSGTSMAAPFVAGILALLKQANRGVSPDGLIQKMLEIPPLSSPDWPAIDYGCGIVQI